MPRGSKGVARDDGSDGFKRCCKCGDSDVASSSNHPSIFLNFHGSRGKLYVNDEELHIKGIK